MSLEEISGKLDCLLEILKRIEERQIRTTQLVEQVEKAEESQVQGSFGSVDTGKDTQKAK